MEPEELDALLLRKQEKERASNTLRQAAEYFIGQDYMSEGSLSIFEVAVLFHVKPSSLRGKIRSLREERRYAEEVGGDTTAGV